LRARSICAIIPNTDHGLRNTDGGESSLAFYQAVVSDTPRPKFSWTLSANGDIRVVSKDKPTAVKLWQATNPEHRDFRLATLGPQYKSGDLEDRGDGVYVGHVGKPRRADGVLRRDDLSERRQVSVQVHDCGTGQSGYGAVSGVQPKRPVK